MTRPNGGYELAEDFADALREAYPFQGPEVDVRPKLTSEQRVSATCDLLARRPVLAGVTGAGAMLAEGIGWTA